MVTFVTDKTRLNIVDKRERLIFSKFPLLRDFKPLCHDRYLRMGVVVAGLAQIKSLLKPQNDHI